MPKEKLASAPGDGDDKKSDKVDLKETIQTDEMQSKLAAFQMPTLADQFEDIEESDDSSEVSDDSDHQEDEQEEKDKKPVKDVKFKREKGFTRMQIEERKKAEKEAAEAKSSLEQISKERDELAAKIATLEEKKENATTDKQYDSLEQKIQALESQMTEKEDQYKKIIEDKDKRIAFFDFTEHPRFRQEFIVPTQEAFAEIIGLVGKDPEARQMLTRVVAANNAALQTHDEESERYEQTRDELISSIVENLPGFRQSLATNLFQKLIGTTQNQAKAVAKWEEMVQGWKTEDVEMQREAAVKQRKYWDNLFESEDKEVSSEIEINEDLQKIIDDEGIDIDISDDERAAKGAIGATNKVTEKEIASVIAKGKQYKKLKGVIQAQQSRIKSLEDIVAKYRGSAPDTRGSGGGSTNERPEKGATMRDKISQFRPPGIR